MKRLLTTLIAGALGATASVAMATSGSLVQFKPKVMPVVVWVNAQGQVTDISPSQPLRPQVRELLLKQIDAWIVKPAEVKGHPVASQFIMDVAFNATPNKDGDYDAGFVYVDSMAMPGAGPVSWAHINGDLELALVLANPLIPGFPKPVWTMQYDRSGYPMNSLAAGTTSRGTGRPSGGSRAVPSSVSTQNIVPRPTNARPAHRAEMVSTRAFASPPFVPTINSGTSRVNASDSVVRAKHP